MSEQTRRFLYEENFVVPFPYAWITANDGKRRLVKNTKDGRN